MSKAKPYCNRLCVQYCRRSKKGFTHRTGRLYVSHKKGFTLRTRCIYSTDSSRSFTLGEQCFWGVPMSIVCRVFDCFFQRGIYFLFPGLSYREGPEHLCDHGLGFRDELVGVRRYNSSCTLSRLPTTHAKMIAVYLVFLRLATIHVYYIYKSLSGGFRGSKGDTP